jgi:small-conductance mechanosensitive channel
LEFLDRQFFGNSVQTWLIATAVALVIWLMLPLLKSRRASLEWRTDRGAGLSLLLRLINGTMQVFAWAVALYVAVRLLNLPRAVERASTILVLVTAWIQAGRWALIVFDSFMERQRARRGSVDAAFAGSVAVIRFVALVTIWSLVLLLVLDNLGVDITALVAGLGIGGVAIALAAQAVLKDLLGSLSIALDHPFLLGDSISVGPITGKVEHIGVKSTRLRSASGEEITVSNAELVQARIRNFGRMEERRGVLIFSIAYETPSFAVKRVNGIAKRVIEDQPGVRFDRCHFRDFGVNGFTFEAVFFVIDSQMDALLIVQQSINLALKDALLREGVAMAQPVQRIVTRAMTLSQPL